MMKKVIVLVAGVGLMAAGSAFAGGAGCIYSQKGEIAKMSPDKDLIPADVLASELTDEQYALYLKEQQELRDLLGGKPVHN